MSVGATMRVILGVGLLVLAAAVNRPLPTLAFGVGGLWVVATALQGRARQGAAAGDT